MVVVLRNVQALHEIIGALIIIMTLQFSTTLHYSLAHLFHMICKNNIFFRCSK